MSQSEANFPFEKLLLFLKIEGFSISLQEQLTIQIAVQKLAKDYFHSPEKIKYVIIPLIAKINRIKK